MVEGAEAALHNLMDLIEREDSEVPRFLRGDPEPEYQRALELELQQLESVDRTLMRIEWVSGYTQGKKED